MFGTARLRLIARTAADACIGLILFAGFAVAVGFYEHNVDTTYRLSDLLPVSASAGDLFKFSIDDSPLIAAAVVATAVPVPQPPIFGGPPPIPTDMALGMLAAIFSAIVALNLAFFRHLRREYASPRRGAVEEGPGSAGGP
ncbi:MAG TPA: hypothetical protein VNR88_07630 [Hyphomicrobium sp.]|nr:hypothetical protein [Hyphomicrobium sp.]